MFNSKIGFTLILASKIMNIISGVFLKMNKSYWVRRIQKRVPKNCILCESWVLFKSPLCRQCRKYLYSEYIKNKFKILNIENYPCCYLWEWNAQNHLWIQKMVLSMKDGDNFELYKILMPWLMKKIEINHLYLDQVRNVMAIPSSDRKHPEALVDGFIGLKPNINTFKILKKDITSQKLKSKSERLKAQFAFEDGDLSVQKSIKKLLVLDDVVSTGGSFRGVLSLLGSNKVLMAAVWAYKSPTALRMQDETF